MTAPGCKAAQAGQPLIKGQRAGRNVHRSQGISHSPAQVKEQVEGGEHSRQAPHGRLSSFEQQSRQALLGVGRVCEVPLKGEEDAAAEPGPGQCHERPVQAQRSRRTAPARQVKTQQQSRGDGDHVDHDIEVDRLAGDFKQRVGEHTETILKGC